MNLLLIILFICISFINGDKLFSMPITIDGIQSELTMKEGETPEMAAETFATSNKLSEKFDETRLKTIISDLSKVIIKKLEESSKSNEPKELFQIDFTFNNQTTIFKYFENQKVSDAIEIYFENYGIPADVKQQILPQVRNAVGRKVNEYLKSIGMRPVSFTLPLTISGNDLKVTHFHGADYVEEVKQFVIQNIVPQYHDVVFPEVVKLIRNEISKTLRPILSLPITIEGQEFNLNHYEGFSITDSAIQFLRDHGITNNDAARKYLSSLVGLLENHLAQIQSRQ